MNYDPETHERRIKAAIEFFILARKLYPKKYDLPKDHCKLVDDVYIAYLKVARYGNTRILKELNKIFKEGFGAPDLAEILDAYYGNVIYIYFK